MSNLLERIGELEDKVEQLVDALMEACAFADKHALTPLGLDMVARWRSALGRDKDDNGERH